MAINFPNTPTDGTTYDYLGITYTYVDSGGGLGYWKVVNAGSLGIATAGDIDTGTNNVKYVTSKGLQDSKYGLPVSIANHDKMGSLYRHRDGIAYSEVAIPNTVTEEVWFSFGPSADVVVDHALPNYALQGDITGVYIQIEAYLRLTSTGVGFTKTHASNYGFSGGFSIYREIHNVELKASLDESIVDQVNIFIPVDSDGRFQLGWSKFGSPFSTYTIKYLGVVIG